MDRDGFWAKRDTTLLLIRHCFWTCLGEAVSMQAGICIDGRVKQIVLPSEGLNRRKRQEVRLGSTGLLTGYGCPYLLAPAFDPDWVSTPWAFLLPGLRTTPPGLSSWTAALGPSQPPESCLLAHYWLGISSPIWLDLKTDALPLVKGALRSGASLQIQGLWSARVGLGSPWENLHGPSFSILPQRDRDFSPGKLSWKGNNQGLLDTGYSSCLFLPSWIHLIYWVHLPYILKSR